VLSKASFRRWLLEHPADAEVGIRWSMADCPYRRCEQEVLGSRSRLQPWAESFMRRIDHVSPEQEPVTAAEALAILESIP
jgi:hypothetical protein